MNAMVLTHSTSIEKRPLAMREVPDPVPDHDEIVVRVRSCGICRTDLHIVEGELPLSRPGIIPGHQIVGEVVHRGSSAKQFEIGRRVGIAWLHRACGSCTECLRGRENLCSHAVFTGYTAQGGFAEFVRAPEAFVYGIPDGFDELSAAPLLCAGIIGFRCLRVADLQAGDSLGIYGFGAAGHVCIQVARHLGIRVFVCTRDSRHQRLAMDLGAEWAGDTFARPPEPLHAAIIFAPSGDIVPAALAAVRRGGTVVLGGIHMSMIPPIDYKLLYYERVLRSVANNTRVDGTDFLRIAAQIPIRPRVETFPLEQANNALLKLKNDAVNGSAVLQP